MDTRKPPERGAPDRRARRGRAAAAGAAWLCAAAALGPAAPGAAPRGAAARPVVVFAAVSLEGALREAGERFAALRPGRAVVASFSASGILLRQIEHGAPADLLLSASAAEIDRLEAAGLLRPGTRATFAANRLVLVTARGVEPPRHLADLAAARFDRVAVANPRTSPAGLYAAEALRAARVDRLLETRLVYGENVRQVLWYVARGEAAAGIVYRTDARAAPGGVAVGPEIPPGSHRPILYQAAVPVGAPDPDGGRALLELLLSDEGQSILARHGFLPPPRP